MTYPVSELDVTVVEVKVSWRTDFRPSVEYSLFIMSSLYDKSIPVYDIHHTGRLCRARKDLCMILYHLELF